jgi:FixJ family two-component response regulator
MRQIPKVLVVDDDAAIRTALKRLFHAAGFLVDCYESADALLLESVTSTASCILLDVQLPGLDGLELQERLADLGQPPPIIFLTGHGTVPLSVRAMKNGARHFFEKPVDGEVLLTEVTAAIAVWEAACKRSEEAQLVHARLASLTPRQRNVLEHVASGQLNKQIAASLGISEKTVKVHRARGLQKLGVRSVAQLVRSLERAASAPRQAAATAVRSAA